MLVKLFFVSLSTVNICISNFKFISKGSEGSSRNSFFIIKCSLQCQDESLRRTLVDTTPPCALVYIHLLNPCSTVICVLRIALPQCFNRFKQDTSEKVEKNGLRGSAHKAHVYLPSLGSSCCLWQIHTH